MDETICLQLENLEKRLDYHSYCVETDTEYEIESLIKKLELEIEKSTITSIPNVARSFQDVIDILHQINQLLLCEGKDEIDRDFFGTRVHLPISFDVSVITKSLLDCHFRYMARGISSEILALYAWLLDVAWHLTLCQDAIDLWENIIEILNVKIQYVDKKLYSQLLECIPPERR